MDLCLSVEASSCVCQPDGVDFTLGGRVSHHRPVHCCICLTVIHTYSACENNKPHKMRQALSHNQHLSYWEVTAKTKVVPFFRFNKKMTKLTKLVLWKHVFPKLSPSELFYPYNTSDKIKSEHKKNNTQKLLTKNDLLYIPIEFNLPANWYENTTNIHHCLLVSVNTGTTIFIMWSYSTVTEISAHLPLLYVFNQLFRHFEPLDTK